MLRNPFYDIIWSYKRSRIENINIKDRAGARFGGGALRQNIFKITAFEKNCCKSYLNANKMKLQKKNKTIINIVKFF